jgi:hypothetical protein
MSKQKHEALITQASFHLKGDGIDVVAISQAIGIEPTKAFHKGDPLGGRARGRRLTGLWSIASSLSEDHILEDHLDYLLRLLEPHRMAILDFMKEGVSAAFYCGMFADTSCGSLELSPRVLARLATFGVPLEVHVYLVSDET